MEPDIESSTPEKIPWLQILWDQGILTPSITSHKYSGSGTENDPYLIEWIKSDPRDPMNFPTWLKWTLAQVVAIATLTVSFVSTAYASAIPNVIADLGGSREVNLLGVSLFVLGFAPGPFLWAPLSELYGRQYLFILTFSLYVLFNAVACASQNLATLLVFRFFAGLFGCSTLTNSGGTIADLFPPSQRGLAMIVFAASPFLGPVLGPIIGGFVAQSLGWRWLEGLMAIFSGTLLIVGTLALPETYAPVLLRKRASRLSKVTGKVYKSHADIGRKGSAAQAFRTAISRPWKLLFREPIVLILCIYQAIIFGTLFMMFAAFPIVYSRDRGWSQGIEGLAFLGLMVGTFIAIAYAIWDNKRYLRVCAKDPSGSAPPETRLPPCCVGSIVLPIGLFWFAWTNDPHIHPLASIAAGVPFGFAMVLTFMGISNYLVDSYTIYAASVLAAATIMRAIFAGVFPLFTTYMYQNLGIHWAASIPAFLGLACTPFPFLFYRYGQAIRVRCRYATEANEYLQKIRGQVPAPKSNESVL